MLEADAFSQRSALLRPTWAATLLAIRPVIGLAWIDGNAIDCLVLYTLTAIPATLIAIQILDSVANAIYTIVALLVIKHRTQGTGVGKWVPGTGTVADQRIFPTLPPLPSAS